MADERLEALKEAERSLAVMRRHAMKVARIVYEADRPNLHWQMMGLVDQIEGVTARLNDLQQVEQLKVAAYDADTVDFARRERGRP